MPVKSARKPLGKVVSALTARTQFGQILRRVSQKNERFIVDRRGDPQAVIMSWRDYIDTIAPAPEALKAIQAEAKRKGLDKLTMRQIDAEIAKMRREQHLNTVPHPPKVLEEIWAESRRKGTDKLTMREINAEIAAFRREKRKKNAAPNGRS